MTPPSPSKLASVPIAAGEKPKSLLPKTGIIAANGLLVLEHGAEQEEAVAELLMAHGWANIRCYKDYSGLPRVTSANYSETP